MQISNAITRCRTRQSAKNTIPANRAALLFRTLNAVEPSLSPSSLRKASRAKIVVSAFTALVSTAARLPVLLLWPQRPRAFQHTALVRLRFMPRPALKARQRQSLLQVKFKSPRTPLLTHRLQVSKAQHRRHLKVQAVLRRRPPTMPVPVQTSCRGLLRWPARPLR